MQLQYIRGKHLLAEYHCELTDELDKMAGFDDDSIFRHYVIVDDDFMKTKCFPIRVPGGTVGGIWFDENRVVTKINIGTEYVVKSYPENVNEVIQKYVGKMIIL